MKKINIRNIYLHETNVKIVALRRYYACVPNRSCGCNFGGKKNRRKNKEYKKFFNSQPNLLKPIHLLVLLFDSLNDVLTPPFLLGLSITRKIPTPPPSHTIIKNPTLIRLLSF